MFKTINSPTKTIDSIVLGLFVIFLTYNPFYLQGALNIYELELYLPAIQGVLNGMVPYRDFFYLRGPFEIYLPAALMSILGMKVSVLSTFFYVGNVLTLILSFLIAQEIFKTRYILGLLTLILTVKTFPRVVFTYWGGMRYCLGLMAIYFAVTFFKTKKKMWIFLAAATAASAFLTSIEVGIASLAAVFLSLIVASLRKDYTSEDSKAFGLFMAGVGVIFIPFLLYTVQTQSLGDYADITYTIATRMTQVIDHQTIAQSPRNLGEALTAMVNPADKNFRHLTPAYLYIIFFFYLGATRRKKESSEWTALVCLWIYGLLLYLASFRSLWGSQFDMALQPEKILYFFLIEGVYLRLLCEKAGLLTQIKTIWPIKKEHFKNTLKVYGIMFIFVGLFMSTVCFAFMRLDKRFYSYQFLKTVLSGQDPAALQPLANESKRKVHLPQMEGFVLPTIQAEDMEGVVGYINQHTEGRDAVFVFPERGGLYNFLMDRPFVGRFPTPTMSWFKDDWHRELINTFNIVKPRYVILPVTLQSEKYKVYFAKPENKMKYDEMMGIINSHYKLKASSVASRIYERK